MAATEPSRTERSWPAIIGWGGLLVFMGLFAWLIIAQLQSAEIWANRKDEAIKLVKNFRPDGKSGNTMDDILKGYSLRAREQDRYVGEFTWDAKHKEGPDYEVTLLWKEGERHRVAVWRVDLGNQEIRPQGNEASSLPQRARRDLTGS